MAPLEKDMRRFKPELLRQLVRLGYNRRVRTLAYGILVNRRQIGNRR